MMEIYPVNQMQCSNAVSSKGDAQIKTIVDEITSTFSDLQNGKGFSYAIMNAEALYMMMQKNGYPQNQINEAADVLNTLKDLQKNGDKPSSAELAVMSDILNSFSSVTAPDNKDKAVALIDAALYSLNFKSDAPDADQEVKHLLQAMWGNFSLKEINQAQIVLGTLDSSSSTKVQDAASELNTLLQMMNAK